MVSGNKLEELAASKNNNLNFIRFVAAIMVIMCHSFPLCYGAWHEDIVGQLTEGMLNLGGIAVGLFFVTGGFLIARSSENKKSARCFFEARIRRIFPSLAVMVLTCVLILGPIFSNLSLIEYFGNGQTYKYLLNILLIPVHSLPGVFENHAYPDVVNGALWTLPVEFACYIGCFLAYKLGFFDKKRFAYMIPFVTIAAIAFFYLFGNNIVLVRIFRPILLYYIGIGYYVFRDQIKIDYKYGIIAIILFGLSILLNFSIWGMLLFFPYMIYWLAYGLPGRLCNFGKKYEISYGMYLWGWPIQQIFSGFGGSFSIWYVNTITATIFVIMLGMVNHIFIEKNNR